MTTVIDNIQSDATFISDGGAVMLDGGWQYGSAGVQRRQRLCRIRQHRPDYDFPRCPPTGGDLFVVLVVMPEYGSSTDRAAVGFI